MTKKRYAFVQALDNLKDKEYIGCSNYIRRGLADSGIIPQKDRENSDGLWAIKNNSSILDNEEIFEKLPPTTQQIEADIQWYAYAHVSVNAGGNDIWESAPCGDNHPYAEGGYQTGKFLNHSYNCSGVPLTCIYRIKEDDAELNIAEDEKEYKLEFTDYSAENVLEYPTLKKGSNGKYVKTLQNILKEKLNIKLCIDGIFGDKTLKYVKQFQTKSNIYADGIVGIKTWKVLLNTKNVEIPNSVLSYGSRGDLVKQLQELLNKHNKSKLEIDGIFGMLTYREVCNFQKKNNINIDGCVGKITWTALLL